MRQSVNNKPGQKQKRRFTRLCEQETKKNMNTGKTGKMGGSAKRKMERKSFRTPRSACLSQPLLCLVGSRPAQALSLTLPFSRWPHYPGISFSYHTHTTSAGQCQCNFYPAAASVLSFGCSAYTRDCVRVFML